MASEQLEHEFPLGAISPLLNGGNSIRSVQHDQQSTKSGFHRSQSSAYAQSTSSLLSKQPSTAISTFSVDNSNHATYRSIYLRCKASMIQALEKRGYVGWRFGVLLGLSASVLSLTGNLVLLAVGFKRGGYKFDVGTLTMGISQRGSLVSTAYHVLINILATLLLSASNYSMQVLSSPTRSEVDSAHQRGNNLDVGIISFHNLKGIAWRRRVLWWILLLSSFPLHLFYNSTISDVTSGRQYEISISSSTNISSRDPTYRTWSTSEWFSVYDRTYVADYGDIKIIVDGILVGINFNDTVNPALQYSNNINGGVFGRGYQISLSMQSYLDVEHNRTGPFASGSNYSGFSWSTFIVSLVADSDEFRDSNEPYVYSSIRKLITLSEDNWINYNGTWLHVAYVFSKVANDSKVQIAMLSMLIVIICNIFKISSMCIMLTSGEPDLLVTIGDALESFLKVPDHGTIGHCMSDEQTIRQALKGDRDYSRVAKEENWRMVVSPKPGELIGQTGTFRLVLSLMLILITAMVPLLLVAFLGNTVVNAGLSRHRWGTASQLTIGANPLQLNSIGILYNTWLANSPQVILSGVYYFVNRLLTQVSSTTEWYRWQSDRKYLRVSRPKGLQRETYFLQLPYRIAIPILCCSALLHWLLSQAFFLRRLEFRNSDSSILETVSKCTVGFSPVSCLVLVVLVIIGGAGMLATIYVNAPKGPMPLGANSSFILSAACHPPPEDVNAHLKALQWGVSHSRTIDSTIAHCSLTSEEVTAPEPDKMYA